MAHVLTLKLNHNCDCECPIGNSGDKKEKIISLRDNKNLVDDYFDWTPQGYVPKIGLRRQLATKTAFMLSLYEHSGRQWSLEGEGMQCRWDTSRMAGIYWLPSDVPADRREEYARATMKEYSLWCNGSCYWYAIEDETGEDIDSCGGFIGEEYMVEQINEIFTEWLKTNQLEELVLAGDATWIADFHDFPKGTGQ